MKDELMSCKNNYVHEDKVQIAEHNMPSEENLISVTELFKVLGDPKELKFYQCYKMMNFAYAIFQKY